MRSGHGDVEVSTVGEQIPRRVESDAGSDTGLVELACLLTGADQRFDRP
jgi:hypothetical protein